jgi:glycosyltransferase involved in cell wall biosynthesis
MTGLRLLFDARSVRTPAGRYVFQGLTTGWAADERVAEVLAAVPADFDPAYLPEGVRPVPLPTVGWIAHVRSALPEIADRERADVIFSPNGFPPRDSRAAVYFQDLHHFRADPDHPLPLRLRAENMVRAAWRSRAAPQCRVAIPVSSDIRTEVAKRLPIPVVLIPNGIDVPDMRWSGEGDTILVIGGRGSRKGESAAVLAWAGLVRARRTGDTRLEIVGVEPAARRQDLEALAQRLGASATVHVIGTVPREALLRRIAECRLAISCSTFEAFGLPVGEALAMGAPVAATSLPAHRELLDRAGAGIAFPVGDHQTLAAIISSTLEGSPPSRLEALPRGWSWRSRAREHLDAYLRYE